MTVTSVDLHFCALPPLSVGARVGQGGLTTPVESLAPSEPSGLVASGWESEGGACSVSVALVSGGGGACAVPSSTAAAAVPISQSRPRGRGGHVAARCSKHNCVLACGDSGHVVTEHEWRHVVRSKDPSGENSEESFKQDLTRLLEAGADVPLWTAKWRTTCAERGVCWSHPCRPSVEHAARCVGRVLKRDTAAYGQVVWTVEAQLAGSGQWRAPQSCAGFVVAHILKSPLRVVTVPVATDGAGGFHRPLAPVTPYPRRCALQWRGAVLACSLLEEVLLKVVQWPSVSACRLVKCDTVSLDTESYVHPPQQQSTREAWASRAEAAGVQGRAGVSGGGLGGVFWSESLCTWRVLHGTQLQRRLKIWGQQQDS